MMFCEDIDGLQIKNPPDFGYHLTFSFLRHHCVDILPHIYFSFDYNHIPAKLMTQA